MVFLEELLFSISLSTVKGMLFFKIKFNHMLFKTNEFPSMSLVVDKVGGFSLFHLLFEVVSGLFKLFLCCFESLHHLQSTTSQIVVFCKVTMNQLHLDFIWGNGYYKVEQFFSFSKQGN